MKFGQTRRADKSKGTAKSGVLGLKSRMMAGKLLQVHHHHHTKEPHHQEEEEEVQQTPRLLAKKKQRKQRSRDPPGHTSIPVSIVTSSVDCSPSKFSSRLPQEQQQQLHQQYHSTSNELDPTEAPSYTSTSSHDINDDDDDDDESDSNSIDNDFDSESNCELNVSFEDPYLEPLYKNNNNTRGTSQQQDQDGTIMNDSSNNNDNIFSNRVVTIKSLSIGHLDQHHLQDPLSSSTLCLRKSITESSDTDVLTFDGEELLPSTPPSSKSIGTKLISLGAFDIPRPQPPPTTPTIDSPTRNTSTNTSASSSGVKRSSKSLGGGCFNIPIADAAEATSASSSSSSSNNTDSKSNGPETPTAAVGLTSPFSSAISKGVKLVLGTTLALPRALTFDLLATRQPERPPTTSSQSAEPIIEEKPVLSASMTKYLLQAAKDCEYWNRVLETLMSSYGRVHAKTAEGLLQLGYAYMQSREYAQAVIAFQSACRIWKQLQRSEEDQLALARVVDAIGMAWARVAQEEDQDHCEKAMTALEEAFQIRYDLLGASHIDTVETLNKIASVHVHLREYSAACDAYWEVFWVRKAIFGAEHPSVAIAAHALGNILVKLASTEDAANFFQIAVEIYEQMNLNHKHPAVKRLMLDYKRLDRICLTSRVPAVQQQQLMPSHHR